MPDWMRDVLIALGSFFGGRAANVLGSQINEGREMRRCLDRLTAAVENIGGDLKDTRNEIHEQGVMFRDELHKQNQIHEKRLENVETRIDSVNQRIDALAASENILIRRSTGQPERRAWERSCRLPGSDHDSDPEQTDSGSGAPR
jgi:hypothetical protein